MTTKRFKSISDLVKHTTDKEFAEPFESERKQRELVATLFALRNAKGLSQADVAKHMGCSQSRVSKLESGVDANITLGDLDKYLESVGFDLGVSIRPKGATVMSLIKYHAFQIRDYLEKMRVLAGNDKEIVNGVMHGHVEVMVNIVRMIAVSLSKLPCDTKSEDLPLVTIEDDSDCSAEATPT